MTNDYNKQYLLFVFDDYRGKDKLVELISLQISSFTSKETNLKFNYGDYGIIYNFESPYNFISLREHIDIILEKVSDQYFLMEFPKNIFAKMPADLKLNLFDLSSKNNTKESNVSDDMSIMEKFLFNISTTFQPDDFIFDETKSDMIDNLFDKIRTGEAKPTIDELLDKIQEKGIESLSKYEKQILDEYSKSKG